MFVDSAHALSNDYRTFWTSLNHSEYQSAQYRRIAKDGRDVWIQASYNPICDKNGKPYKVIKYATDITNEVLKNAEYKGQLDAIGKAQAVIHFNTDGTIEWANINFLQALGYSLNEIQGQHHRIFVKTEYANSLEYRQLWDDLRAGKFSMGEFCRYRKDGKEIWIQASYNPIFDPNGKVFKVVKFATDITQQYIKRTENERILNQVDTNLESISKSIVDATERSSSAAAAATQASATVQMIASGAEELSSSIREISESMSRSRQEIENMMSHTLTADHSTQKLSEAAEQMSEIVGLIQDIANQINLLALNATIESARAGDAGKGFAVVASEVKSLASQVGAATDKISLEINEMQSISHEVVNSLETIKNSVRSVENSVTSVATAIEEQSAVTSEISNNMQTASVAVHDVDVNLKEILLSMEVSGRYTQDVYKNLRNL